jgi:transposase
VAERVDGSTRTTSRECAVIDAELYAAIRRHYFADHWKVGTIAQQLGIHPDTVRRAISVERFNAPRTIHRQMITDPFVPYIREILEHYPRLRATRVYEMVRARGYEGSVVQLRRVVRTLRPVPAREAMLRLKTLPGEQGQVDWASFGKIRVGRAERALSCFVLTLSWSRALWFEFSLDQTLESFLRGHVHAFDDFGGTPRDILHDNLTSAVLERRGELARLHPRYLELAGHYHFGPKPCRLGRGSDKGRVERTIHYIRHSFFPARRFVDVADLNAQAIEWRDAVAHARPWPGGDNRTVAEVFAEEQTRLHKLPQHPFDCDALIPVRSGKTHYVRFDRNDYSIPHTAIERNVVIAATDRTVRILDGATEIARHHRSWDRGQVIDDPAHKEALLAHRRRALRTEGQTVLTRSVPEVDALIDATFQAGEPQSRTVRSLESLLRLWGADALRAAVVEVLRRGTPSLTSLHVILEQQHRQRRRPAVSPLDLGDRPELEALHVQPHSLEDYDDLTDDNDD